MIQALKPYRSTRDEDYTLVETKGRSEHMIALIEPNCYILEFWVTLKARGRVKNLEPKVHEMGKHCITVAVKLLV